MFWLLIYRLRERISRVDLFRSFVRFHREANQTDRPPRPYSLDEDLERSMLMTQFTVSRRAVLGGAASALLVPAAAHATTPARHYDEMTDVLI